jgi:hypothetical protein
LEKFPGVPLVPRVSIGWFGTTTPSELPGEELGVDTGLGTDLEDLEERARLDNIANR